MLRHRGPDGEGRFVDAEVGMGHRRLSIIDLEGGSQPIANEDGSLHVVFNGEIYNFIELREELEKRNHIFKTRSDTEVIVHAYEQWGKDCVNHFNGMFAFALWDQKNSELFLARDHLGIKPLYYLEIGDKILFSSEIKAILQDPECPRDVDIEALAELFTFRYVPSPKTLFNGIRKLPPAHRMIINASGIEVERYWNWIPIIRKNFNENELILEYQSLLEDAVRLQLRSDVPLGLFLSSGVDSGVLLAIMSQYLSEPCRAFTIGFEGGENTNEVEDAKSLARMFGATHSFMMVTPKDYLNYYEKYIWDIEEPLGNETAAAFYFVSRITREHVKVALTGQGADEPWAGYGRHIGARISTFYSRLPSLITGSLESLVSRIPGRIERLKRGVASLAEPDMLTRLTKIYSFFTGDMKQQLFKGLLKDQITGDAYQSKKTLRRLQLEVQDLDPLTQMLYIDTRTNLPDDLLMVADKTSMANSLETRVPLLDYRLIEFIESLPPKFKLNGFTAKYLHKKALQKWLPREVVYRKKKGFANPIETWLRTTMRPFVEEQLLSSDSGVRYYFDQEYINHMLESDRNGNDQFRRHIYLLLSFEMWYRKFIRA
jgi:asparagine synthase (glutamine-hydrolysing)